MTTKKQTIMEAAAEIFNGNRSTKNAAEDKFGLGTNIHPNPVQTTSVIDIGGSMHKSSDPLPDFTKGVPSAKPPGATPPTGQEPMKKLAPQPQQSQGHGDNSDPAKTHVNMDINAIANRQDTSTPSRVHPGNGNVLPQWAHESAIVLAAHIINELEELDEVAFRYRKQTKAKQKKNRAASEKAPAKYDYKSNDSTKAKVAKIKEAIDSEYEGVDEEDIVDFLDEIEEGLLEAKKDWKDPKNTKSWSGGGIAFKPSEKKTVKEHVDAVLEATKATITEDVTAIFAGETLSEEFTTKATTIFEAAVVSRVNEVATKLDEAFDIQLDEAVEEIQVELTEKVDGYLNYMVQEWISENEIAIEKGLRAEIVENFITGLRGLFIENYIDIPEEKVDLVSELSEKVAALEESLNSEITKNVAMNKTLSEARKNDVLHTVCEGLMQTQADKVKSLAEGVEFTNETEFKSKLTMIRESYYPTTIKVPSKESLNTNQVVLDEAEGYVNPDVKMVAETMSRMKFV